MEKHCVFTTFDETKMNKSDHFPPRDHNSVCRSHRSDGK